jgi:hypothetical protein
VPTRKIADLPKPGYWRKPKDAKPPCQHPEHNPAQHIVRPPGVYEHECPGCHRKITFVVQGYWWGDLTTDIEGRSLWAVRRSA